MINFGISSKDGIKYVYVSDSDTGEAYSIPFMEMLIVSDYLYEKEVSFKSYDKFGSCDIYASYDCTTDVYKVLIEICGVYLWDYSKSSYENVWSSLSSLIKNGVEDIKTNVYLCGRQFYITPELYLCTDTLYRGYKNDYYVGADIYFRVYPLCDSSNYILTCRSLVRGFSFFVVFNRETSKRVVTGGGNFFDFVFLSKDKRVECHISILHSGLLINNVPFVLERAEAKSLKKYLSRFVGNKV